ncbi:MAG: ABC transporter substrate-binding protein, partial [Rhodospirillales bacterium]|nr:ABC transporter substrate-binding protein [Rhodospirillales bacterium]
MTLTKLTLAAVGLAIGISGFAVAEAKASEQFIPSLVYRTGPYAPNGVPFADGAMDYYKMLNARDGGINGVKVVVEECDTGYNTDRGVECYERLKGKGETGAAAFSPLSTGITYAIIERATKDKIPVFSMGYGRTDASDGRVFPYVFTAPSTYWSQASALVRYV